MFIFCVFECFLLHCKYLDYLVLFYAQDRRASTSALLHSTTNYPFDNTFNTVLFFLFVKNLNNNFQTLFMLTTQKKTIIFHNTNHIKKMDSSGSFSYQSPPINEPPKRSHAKQKHWKKEQDNLLRLLVQEHGTHDWEKISSLMQNRNKKQCRERFQDHLQNNIAKNQWSAQQQWVLYLGVFAYGQKWKSISQALPGRNGYMSKRQYKSKKMNQSFNKLEQRLMSFLKQMQKNGGDHTVHEMIESKAEALFIRKIISDRRNVYLKKIRNEEKKKLSKLEIVFKNYFDRYPSVESDTKIIRELEKELNINQAIHRVNRKNREEFSEYDSDSVDYSQDSIEIKKIKLKDKDQKDISFEDSKSADKLEIKIDQDRREVFLEDQESESHLKKEVQIKINHQDQGEVLLEDKQARSRLEKEIESKKINQIQKGDLP